MAYRRRQGITRASTFKEETHLHDDDDDTHTHQMKKNISNININNINNINDESDNGWLATKAIRASAAHRDSSAYGYAYVADSASAANRSSSPSSTSFAAAPQHSFPSKGSYLSESNSMNDSNEPKYGLWGVLARKAKSILDEEDPFDTSNKTKPQTTNSTTNSQFNQSRQTSENGPKVDNAKLRKRFDAITSSLNQLGDTIGNAFEEGRTIVESKTADIIQETRNKTADIKLQLRRRGGGSDSPDQATVVHNTSWQRPVMPPVQTSQNQETQLKASRDVAMATAAKAKVLLRELKTVKADLAFAKERCAQLEEENKRLRENREKGDNPADDDLIRLQLETLLAEKARLAHENSIYARENRFLREIVEYHQLTMQDVVYLDEGAEEVSEVYPFSFDAKVLSGTPTSPASPTCLPEVSSLYFTPEVKDPVGEDSQEAANSMTSSSSQTSPPKASPPSSSQNKIETSEVQTSSETVVEQQKPSTCNNASKVDEDPIRPAASLAKV